MTPPAAIGDDELEANAAETAAEVLAHPLARRFDWQMVDVLQAIAAGDASIGLEDARQVLRLALVGIDAGEIKLGLERR